MNLDDVRDFVGQEHGLAVVTTVRPDGSVQATVVNVGVLDHPVSGEPVVGYVVFGNTRKLVHLRDDRRATVTVRHGWEWVTVEGEADLLGPDDPFPGFDATALPALLRNVFTAAGGTHDDWDTYDRVMVEERRAAVLVTPKRIYGQKR